MEQEHTKDDVDRIVETFVYLYTESRRATKEVARQHGLTGPQITVIKLLEACGDLSLSELSTRMRAKNSTLTGIVDRMASNDLVRRVRSEVDRRVVLIELTAKGRGLADEVPVESMQIFGTALLSLNEEERETLWGLLRKVSDAVRHEVAARGE